MHGGSWIPNPSGTPWTPAAAAPPPAHSYAPRGGHGGPPPPPPPPPAYGALPFGGYPTMADPSMWGAANAWAPMWQAAYATGGYGMNAGMFAPMVGSHTDRAPARGPARGRGSSRGNGGRGGTGPRLRATVASDTTGAPGTGTHPVSLDSVPNVDSIRDKARLAKAISRVARPTPPWCLGRALPDNLADEITVFAAFSAPCTAEREATSRFVAELVRAAREFWPAAVVLPVGLTAVPLQPVFAKPQFALLFSPDQPDSIDPTDPVLDEVNRFGLALAASDILVRRLGEDARGTTVWQLTRQGEAHADNRHGTTTTDGGAFGGEQGSPCSVLLRFGERATTAVRAGIAFSQHFSRQQEGAKEALLAIDAVLRQAQYVSDTVFVDYVSSEALMVMVLSIVNSYDPEDELPRTSHRIMQDFFLTFGFEENFNLASRSIVQEGMAVEVGKMHPRDALSVLDVAPPPAGPGALPAVVHNMTAGVSITFLRVLVAVLHYCYRAVQSFVDEPDLAKRRAQSALSTILGADTFWMRVVGLFSVSEPPFDTYVRANEDAIRTAYARGDVEREPTTAAAA